MSGQWAQTVPPLSAPPSTRKQSVNKNLLSLPSLILINPAALTRAPCRKLLCWNAPLCLIPTYSLKLLSTTKIHVFFFVVFLNSLLSTVDADTWNTLFGPWCSCISGLTYRSAMSLPPECELPELEIESDDEDDEILACVPDLLRALWWACRKCETDSVAVASSASSVSTGTMPVALSWYFTVVSMC